MVPLPAVVTMNSEPHTLQKYLFPDSFANFIPPDDSFLGHYIYRDSVGQLGYTLY